VLLHSPLDGKITYSIAILFWQLFLTEGIGQESDLKSQQDKVDILDSYILLYLSF